MVDSSTKRDRPPKAGGAKSGAQRAREFRARRAERTNGSRPFEILKSTLAGFRAKHGEFLPEEVRRLMNTLEQVEVECRYWASFNYQKVEELEELEKKYVALNVKYQRALKELDAFAGMIGPESVTKNNGK